MYSAQTPLRTTNAGAELEPGALIGNAAKFLPDLSRLSRVNTTVTGKRLQLRLAGLLLVPAAITHAIVRHAPIRLNVPSQIALYCALVVALLWSAPKVRRLAQQRRARKAGAPVVPRIRGRLPGNYDFFKELITRLPIEDVGQYWAMTAEQVGMTYNYALFGADTIYTSEPSVIKSILTGDSFRSFGKGEFMEGIMSDVFGEGIFSVDGDRWKMHRAMTRPFFANEKVSDFDCFSTHSEKLLETIKRLSNLEGSSSSHSKGAVEVQDLFGRFTLDAATEFLMSGTLASLDDAPVQPSGPKAFSTQFLEAFNLAQYHVFMRARKGDTWPLAELKGSPNLEPMKVISKLVDDLIQKALDKPREKGDEQISLLSNMIAETRDPKMLRDEILNILLASRDTTQSLLTSAVYVCSRQPEIFKRLRAEVLDEIGENTPNPTYDQARGLRYMRAFLNEVLRLFPPVPFNGRSALEDVVVMSEGEPLFIPKGARVTYAVVHTHRRRDLWGPTVLDFDPDRWFDDRLDLFKKNPFIFVPFNAGPRICLGQNFAYNEATFCLIRLLQTYDRFELASDIQPEDSYLNGELHRKAQITLQYKRGVWVRFHEAVEA